MEANDKILLSDCDSGELVIATVLGFPGDYYEVFLEVEEHSETFIVEEATAAWDDYRPGWHFNGGHSGLRFTMVSWL